jgi:Outer membrane protein beta-barrel domain
LILLLLTSSGFSQKKYTSKNLQKFDTRWYHFGFLLGYNSSDLYIDKKVNFGLNDSLLSIDTENKPGFNLGIVTSLNFSKNVSLRFIPTLSFQDRLVNYSFLNNLGKEEKFIKKLESTNILFPLDLKLRTDRINNFAAYLLLGGNYSIDMQSQKDVSNKLSKDIILKLQKNNINAEFGGGFDFFLEYFKFGIEMKVEHGIPNLVVRDNSIFSNPIDKMRSRTFVLTFTFEG